MNIQDKLLKILLLFFSLLYFQSIIAQNDRIMVQPLEKSSTSPYNFDIYAYCRMSWQGSKISTGTNYQFNPKQRKMNQQTFNVGVEFDLYRNIRHHFLAGIGYSYTHLAFINSPFTSTGVHIHWLNIDAKYLFLHYEAGVESGWFLGGSEKSHKSSDVTGITPNCYNRLYLKPYLGVSYSFQKVKLEARLGCFVIPKLDANRVAYNNLLNTEINLLCFEVGVAYRIFTTRKSSISNYPIDKYF